MRFFKRQSEALEIPDNCDDERELFIESHDPVEFEIRYYDQEAIELFDEAESSFLPQLPWGYHWEKVEERYGIHKHNAADTHQIKLILYGPDEKSQINYNLVVDGNNFYSLAHTRNKTQPRLGPGDRKYPFSAADYTVGDTKYMPGHCVDHVDSIIPRESIVNLYGKDCNSSYNSYNYIPEVQHDYWGLTMRKNLVQEQRDKGCGYAQLVEYPDKPKITISGVAVPESVYFYRLDSEYNQSQAIWIDWDTNYKNHKKPKSTKENKLSMTSYMGKFSTSLDAAPKALIWDVNNSVRTWRKEVRDSRSLGHNIRNKTVESYNRERDQLYAYAKSSALEFTDTYSSISLALAASPLKKIKLVKENLNKVVRYGQRLVELDEKTTPIDENRYEWVKRYHDEEKPGFEDEGMIDVVKRLASL